MDKIETSFQRGIVHRDDTAIFITGPRSALPEKVLTNPKRHIDGGDVSGLEELPEGFFTKAIGNIFKALAGWVRCLRCRTVEVNLRSSLLKHRTLWFLLGRNAIEERIKVLDREIIKYKASVWLQC